MKLFHLHEIVTQINTKNNFVRYHHQSLYDILEMRFSVKIKKTFQDLAKEKLSMTSDCHANERVNKRLMIMNTKATFVQFSFMLTPSRSRSNAELPSSQLQLHRELSSSNGLRLPRQRIAALVSRESRTKDGPNLSLRSSACQW